MRNNALEITIVVKNHPIRSRTATGIHLIRVQDGKLLVRFRVREVEPLVVVVRVGIVAAPRGAALSVVGATLRDGGVDVALVVACAAAGVDAGLALWRWSMELSIGKGGEGGLTGSRGLAAANAHRKPTTMI